MNKTSVSPATKLESNPCSRCGGEGKLTHFGHVYGGICFKCNGAKKVFTKRGFAANQYLITLRSVRADTLKVGDLVREQTMAGPNALVTAFMPVEFIAPLTLENAGGWSIVDGKPFIPPNTLKVVLSHKKWGGLSTTYQNERLVRIACSAEFKTATLQQALAYQATLTKTGTPTKATEAFLASNPSAKLPANILKPKTQTP